MRNGRNEIKDQTHTHTHTYTILTIDILYVYDANRLAQLTLMGKGKSKVCKVLFFVESE